MPKKAKLFQNGGSQAVRLPADFRFEGEEVHIEKVGNTVVLRPLKHSWAEFFTDPSTAPDDFMQDRQDDPPQERELF